MIFPNVPNLPGVPALPRSPLFPPQVGAILGVLEGKLWDFFVLSPLWGVFDLDGNKIIPADSVVDLNFKNEFKVSDFPVAPNEFANYNKVALPNTIRIQLSRAGSESDRTEFENIIDRISASLELCQVITPSRTYLNMNISNCEYSRSAAKGANIIFANLTLIEIRQVLPLFSNTTTQNAKQPDAASPANIGKVQPVEPKQSVLSILGEKVGL